jgi:hypothetical protein
MISPNSDFSSKPNEKPPRSIPPAVPRLDSLQHRLQHAKDADGKPVPLLDELLFFLDDPPPGTGDRWQKGADLCEGHGIKTSRMAVWRFYRAHILQWRREQIPAPPEPPPSPEKIARLHDQARHLAAQRVLEALNDPRLSPGHLIGLIQNDNQRQQIQLARDQFNDRIKVRHDLAVHQVRKGIERDIREKYDSAARLKSIRQFLKSRRAIPPRTTS